MIDSGFKPANDIVLVGNMAQRNGGRFDTSTDWAIAPENDNKGNIPNGRARRYALS